MAPAGFTGSPGQMFFHGGSADGIGVQVAPALYLVTWGWTSDPFGELPYLKSFLQGIGGSSWADTNSQYCQGVPVNTRSCVGLSGAQLITNPTDQLAGVWQDPSQAPTTPTETDLANEAQAAAAHFGNTNQQSNLNTQYIIATASHKNTAGFGTSFCGWHSAASGPNGDISFTNLPYMTDAGTSCGENAVNFFGGTLDGVSIVEGHEYAEAVTDPIPDTGWLDASGGTGETGDKCAWIQSGQGAMSNVNLSSGRFAMQSLWSNAFNNNSGGCVMSTQPSQFSIAVAPSSGSVNAGASASTNVSAVVVSGNPESIALSTSGLPSGVTASFNQSPVTTGGSSLLTFATSIDSPVGSYNIRISGTAPSGTRSAIYTLSIRPPATNDFGISLSPNSGSISPGASTTSNISTSLISGQAETIALSASGLPSGSTAGFSPATIQSGSPSQLTITTSANTPPGQYAVTITGTAPSATHSTTYTLIVLSSDFSLVASPNTGKVYRGSSKSTTINTAVVSGVAQSITLTLSGVPSGVTAALSPSTVGAGSASTLSMKAASAAPRGTYVITITGTADSGTHSTTYTLTVS